MVYHGNSGYYLLSLVVGLIKHDRSWFIEVYGIYPQNASPRFDSYHTLGFSFVLTWIYLRQHRLSTVVASLQQKKYTHQLRFYYAKWTTSLPNQTKIRTIALGALTVLDDTSEWNGVINVRP